MKLRAANLFKQITQAAKDRYADLPQAEFDRIVEAQIVAANATIGTMYGISEQMKIPMEFIASAFQEDICQIWDHLKIPELNNKPNQT